MLAVVSLIRAAGVRSFQDLRPAEIRKKQTQPNPLRLSLIDSVRYLTFEKTKPIGIKCLIFNLLKQKKAVFLKKMDQIVGSLSPISQNRTLADTENGSRKIEIRTTEIGNETGMYFRMRRCMARLVSLFPICQRRGIGNRKLETGGQHDLG